MPILDTRNLYRIWVNTEPVTYFSRTNGVLATVGFVIPTSKRMVIKKDFLPSDSFLLKMDIQWCFAVAELNLASPPIVCKVEDVFQDGSGVRWIIKKTEDHESSIKTSCLRLQGVA
jgi:hypothetical protein